MHQQTHHSRSARSADWRWNWVTIGVLRQRLDVSGSVSVKVGSAARSSHVMTCSCNRERFSFLGQPANSWGFSLLQVDVFLCR